MFQARFELVNDSSQELRRGFGLLAEQIAAPEVKCRLGIRVVLEALEGDHNLREVFSFKEKLREYYRCALMFWIYFTESFVSSNDGVQVAGFDDEIGFENERIPKR